MLRRPKFIWDHYQFKAIVKMADEKCPGPELDSPWKLEGFFGDYNIAAISQQGPHKSGHPPDRDSICGYCYVCCDSSEELAKFIADNNERRLGCARQIEVRQCTMPWHEPK
ncbi:hypothetical protein F5Y18DRAFT_78187 [Xylariaceae sp. FL1019]|nr:hypothetical protein F5Y18DRAFT_78187 [Xylariaceae sp. FL1019]